MWFCPCDCKSYCLVVMQTSFTIMFVFWLHALFKSNISFEQLGSLEKLHLLWQLTIVQAIYHSVTHEYVLYQSPYKHIMHTLALLPHCYIAACFQINWTPSPFQPTSSWTLCAGISNPYLHVVYLMLSVCFRLTRLTLFLEHHRSIP